MTRLRIADDLDPRWVLAALDSCRPVAVRHPLGFACLPIDRDEDHVCVHVWTERLDHARPTTSLIHCHSWDLTSRVLHGRVRNHLVRVVDDPVSGTHRVFDVRSDGDRDRIVPTPRLVRWERVATTSHRVGDTYVLPAGRFHMTAVPGHEAATVVRARARPDLADQSLGLPDQRGHSVYRQHYDPDETAVAIQAVREWLAEDHDTRGTTPW